MQMLRTYSVIEQGFVKGVDGKIVGIEPLRVSESMAYSGGELKAPFGFSYDTAKHGKRDVQESLDKYPPFISRLFRNVISRFSHDIWRRWPLYEG